MRNPSVEAETYFDRGAWLVLATALGIILFGTVILFYNFSLPTDGWLLTNPGEFHAGWFYQKNLVGVPSLLIPGDRLEAIEGLSLAEAKLGYETPPADWVVGRYLRVSIERNGQLLVLEVPIVHWTLAAWLRNNIASPTNLASILSVILLLVIGLFTFFKRPGNLAARVLLIICASFFALSLCNSLPVVIPVLYDMMANIASFLPFVLISGILVPSFLTFNLVFPRPKRLIQRYHLLALLPYIVGLFPAVLDLAGFPPNIGVAVTFGMVLATIASLVHSALNQRDAISQAQIRWVLFGLGLGIACIFAGWISFFIPVSKSITELFNILITLGPVVIGISLSVAILRYHLFDIDVIIRRTIVYGSLTITLGVVYFSSIILLQGLFQLITGQLQSQVVIVISTLAIAALFSPLRRRIQHDIDRRFYRRKYDAEKTLADFGASLRDQVDLEALNSSLLKVVEDTLQPEHVLLWLKPFQYGKIMDDEAS